MNRRNSFIIRKERKFGEKIEASFEFIRLTRKPLFKGLLFYTSPFILTGMFLLGYLISTFLTASIETSRGLPSATEDIMGLGMSVLGFLFLMVFAGTMLMAIVYSTLRLYEEKGSADFTHKDIWGKARKVYWALFGTLILYGIAFMIVYFIVALIFASVFAGLPALTALAMYLVIAVYMVIVFMTTCGQVFDGKPLGKAFSDAFRVLRDNWWASIGLLIVMLFIYNALMPLFTLPYYLNIFVTLNTGDVSSLLDPPLYYQLLNYVMAAILLLGSFFAYSLSIVGMGLQYFSLSEMRNAKWLIKRIEEMGQAEMEEEESY